MVDKKFCDICGIQIPSQVPDSTYPPWSGTFHFFKETILEDDDLCVECGEFVYNYVVLLKKIHQKAKAIRIE